MSEKELLQTIADRLRLLVEAADVIKADLARAVTLLEALDQKTPEKPREERP